MASEDAIPLTQRTLAAVVLVAMVSGVVVALDAIASMPLVILVAAASAFVGSVAALGVLTYRESRSSNSSFGSALRQSLRATIKVLLALLP